MEIKERTILELLLGLIFVAFLTIIILLIVYIPEQKQTAVQTPNIVQNSYNTLTYNQIVYQQPNVVNENTIKNVDYDFSNQKKEFLKYSSYGQHTKEKTLFNNYKDEFDIYVVNKDYTGGYFKVMFNFCDYYDNCFSETVEKYISAKTEVKFVYLDVQSEQYKYHHWDYYIIAPKID